MKLKLSDLHPNPFKKEINKGKLNEEQIKKIMSNMKDLGLMGALPIFKKDNKYYLIAGHHRVEALKRTYGKGYEIEVVVHNYDTSQTLRGMVVENLSQRGNDFREEIPNVLAVQKFLKSTLPKFGNVVKRPQGGGTQPTGYDSISIAKWINGNVQDSVISKTRVCELLNVYKNIPEEIIESATHKQGSIKDTKKLRYDQLVSLSKIEDKEEVKKVADALVNSENQRVLDHRKFVNEYITADEETKDKIKKGEMDIADIEEVNYQKRMKDSNKETSTKEFIPGFEDRIRDFEKDVNRLEHQVNLFRKVFYNKNFNSRYNSLGKKEKKFLDTSIYGIQTRVKKCYTDVDYFVNKLDEVKKIEMVKK